MKEEKRELIKAYEGEICLLINEKKQLNKKIKSIRAVFTRYKKCKWYQFKRKRFFLSILNKEINS